MLQNRDTRMVVSTDDWRMERPSAGRRRQLAMTAARDPAMATPLIASPAAMATGRSTSISSA